MSYEDLTDIETPATGDSPSAAWGQQVRDNFEAIVNPAQACVYNSAVQSVANDTLTTLDADSELWDTDGMHSTTSNKSRITCVTPGKYVVATTVSAVADADGYRYVGLLVNGSGQKTIDDRPGSSVQVYSASGSRRIQMAVGDYVEVQVRHTAGAALNYTLEEFSAKWDGL